MLTMAAFHLGAACYYAGYFNSRSHWVRSIINVISTTCAFAVTITMSVQHTEDSSACFNTKPKGLKHAEIDFWKAQKASMPSGNKMVTGLTLS